MSVKNSYPNEKIKHLTSFQINELMDRYYNDEKISLLLDTYNIEINPSKLYTLFPPTICEDTFCPNCNAPMMMYRKSRSSSSPNNNITDIMNCTLCNHTDKLNCECAYCSQERKIGILVKEEENQKESQNKILFIKRYFSIENYEPIAVSELTSIDRIYLGTLLRLCLSEDLTYIQAIATVKRELSPTVELRDKILLSLFCKSLIKVHPNSTLSAFTGKKNGTFPFDINIYKTNYYLNVGPYDLRDKIVNDLINPPENYKFDDKTIYEVWKEIALAECLDYLNFQMDKVCLEFNPGEKTMGVINDFLNYFSISEIYGIIYNGITSAVRYLQEKHVSREHAANYVIGACQRYAERAVANRWDIKKFNRISGSPQTMLSEFFFNRVLKIGDDGFYSPISKVYEDS